jgi:hypothetical protein
MRRIEPLPLPADVTPGAIDTAPPRMIMVRLDQLFVDEKYQRDLSDRSVRLIHRIVTGWSWRKFNPPIVAERDEPGTYDVLNGQHTAIAAASHGGIAELPVMLVEAGSVVDRAGAFVSHNRDRVVMQASQLLHAEAAAGDEDAQTVLLVCQRAGVTLLRNPPQNGRFKPRDTIAVAVIRRLISKRGAMRARQVLETCAKAEAAPLSADLIKAVEELLCGPDYASEMCAENLTVSIARLPEHETRIAELSAAKKLPRWRAMTIVLYQTTRKRKAA